MSDDENIRIYVRLLDEGTDVWRPVEAERMDEGSYRLTTGNTSPEGERWQFSAGDVVRCGWKTFSDGTRALVALERADFR